MISVAELSWQIVISQLSLWILGAMRLTMPYSVKLELLSSRRFWFKLFGYAWFLASPIILLFKAHNYAANLFSCPFCVAMWLAVAANLFYLKLDITSAIVLAPVALVFVAILGKLHE